MKLENKVALITGGSSGIGRATAELFLQEGASVVVSDLDDSKFHEIEREIGVKGGKMELVKGDVTVRADAERMVATACDRFGALDILINSAGISALNAFTTEVPHEDIWDKVIDVNLKGTYLVSWFAVEEMKRSGGGSIINLASIMALVGYPVGWPGGGVAPYNPAKGAVLQFTRNLSIDCAKSGIRVNCICPGFVETNLTKGLTDDPHRLAFLEERHPMGRLGRPDEIAKAALFLASDDASFITGSPLIVDGGNTAQ